MAGSLCESWLRKLTTAATMSPTQKALLTGRQRGPSSVGCFADGLERYLRQGERQPLVSDPLLLDEHEKADVRQVEAQHEGGPGRQRQGPFRPWHGDPAQVEVLSSGVRSGAPPPRDQVEECCFPERLRQTVVSVARHLAQQVEEHVHAEQGRHHEDGRVDRQQFGPGQAQSAEGGDAHDSRQQEQHRQRPRRRHAARPPARPEVGGLPEPHDLAVEDGGRGEPDDDQ